MLPKSSRHSRRDPSRTDLARSAAILLLCRLRLGGRPRRVKSVTANKRINLAALAGCRLCADR
jgi:hypothetical protein